jgi:hypothetical protein
VHKDIALADHLEIYSHEIRQLRTPRKFPAVLSDSVKTEAAVVFPLMAPGERGKRKEKEVRKYIKTEERQHDVP